MKLSNGFQSKLQIQLSVIVIAAFGLALIASTTAVMVPIAELGRIAIDRRLHDEQGIIEQRIIDWGDQLLTSSILLSQQIAISSSISLDDPSSVQAILDLSASTLGHDLVSVMGTDAAIVGSFFDNPELNLPEISALNDWSVIDSAQEAGTRLVILNQGYLLLAFAPVWGVEHQIIGYVVIGDMIGSELLGRINFYRNNVALSVFASASEIQGVSANEAQSIAHLSPSETEMLRLPTEMQEQVERGASIRLFDVSVRGTPHAIVYRLLPISDGIPMYYAIAIDENEPRAVQNVILIVSVGTIFIVTLLIGVLVSESLRRSVIRPLQILSENAQRFGAGQLDARITSMRTDEIGQLYIVFNTMADGIQLRAQELNMLNSVLEARVLERTLQVESQAAWLESIFCQAQEAIVVSNSNGDIRLINEVALSLLNMKEAGVLGTPLKQIMESASKQPFTLPDAGAKVQGEVGIGGRHYQYSVVALNLDMAADFGGYVLVLFDVTALRRLSALQSQVIRLASHDLRSPITSLGLQLYLLGRQSGPLSAQQEAALADMQNTINAMRDMINNLLNVERIEQQVAGFSETVNLASLVASTLSLLDIQFSEKGQIVSTELPDNLPMVQGDPVRLLEVLRNLLSNAHKYTPQGGQIRISVFICENDLCVEVSDSGIGIDEDDLPHVFEAQFRAKTALDSAEEGQGIGLSLVKTIIAEHGGQVWVSSQIGQGSTFGFQIPLMQSSIALPV